jgi:hypothetical protein
VGTIFSDPRSPDPKPVRTSGHITGAAQVPHIAPAT